MICDGVVFLVPELHCNLEILGRVEVLGDVILDEELRLEVVAFEVADGGRDVDGEAEHEDREGAEEAAERGGSSPHNASD